VYGNDAYGPRTHSGRRGLRIDGQSIVPDIDEPARGTGLRQRFGGGNERVRNGDDFVAGADAEGLVGEPQCVGTAADRDRARSSDERCKVALKPVDFGAAHERRSLDGAPEGVNQLWLQCSGQRSSSRQLRIRAYPSWVPRRQGICTVVLTSIVELTSGP
jgi:hypothetical protein